MIYSADTKANKSDFDKCNNKLRIFKKKFTIKQFLITVKFKVKRENVFSLLQFNHSIAKQMFIGL